MLKSLKNIIEPQLFVEQTQPAIAISNKVKLSLYKKSSNSGISVDILEEVYRRGYSIWNEEFKGTKEQFAFDRVNSFISGGFAAKVDNDLLEKEFLDKPTPTAKEIADKFHKPLNAIKKQIKSGVKTEKEHTSDTKIADEIARDHVNEKPNYYKKLRTIESFETSEKQSKNPNDSSSRFDSTKSARDIYAHDTPGQPKLKTIKKIKKILKK